jgi:hypothetical protein
VPTGVELLGMLLAMAGLVITVTTSRRGPLQASQASQTQGQGPSTIANKDRS